MSDRECLTDPFEDEEGATGSGGGGALLHPAVQSYMYTPMGADSDDSPDEDTLKCSTWSDNGRVGGRAAANSDTDSTSSDDDDGEDDAGDRFDSKAPPDSEYRTLAPSSRADKSTRCDTDFRWLRSSETPPGGERVSCERQRPRDKSEEFGSGSLDRRRRKVGDRSDRDRKTASSVTSKPPQHPTSQSVSPRRFRDPPGRTDDSPYDLQRRWNSYEHFRWPDGGGGGGGGGGGWWPMCWCHTPPPPPPCCRDHAQQPSPWVPYPHRPQHSHLSPHGPTNSLQSLHTPCKNDAEERARRLEVEKESLQLQVQVLSEQVAAQADKMADLERALVEQRARADCADDALQKEMLARSSLETQKLELLSKLSETRLRAAERDLASPAQDIQRPPPPRTPPANYGRQIERNAPAYASLPRAALAVAFGKPARDTVAARGRSVPNLAEKDEVIPPRGSPSPSLRNACNGGARSRLARLEGGELARGGLRATALPRLQRDHLALPWQTVPVSEWDAETTCGWLESLSLEVYCGAARAWLGAAPDARGLIASASAHTIEKELALKHPMHRKKIMLALLDLQGGSGDALLSSAGRLDAAWALRWVEDAGLAGARDAAADAALDGRTLHRLTHDELHHHLRVNTLLHALSVRRGIQVLRENNFNAETMVRRGAAGEGCGEEGVAAAQLARWSSHRVMQWLQEIDLAEYAPNLRGAGVHGGLILYEDRFTAELLAALLNIPASKTLLRRHLTQRFNDLLGRDVIQQKRTAEQTLGYQPLVITAKYKVPKKSQFSLKRRKSRDELDVTELVCPLHDDCSGDATTNSRSATEAA